MLVGDMNVCAPGEGVFDLTSGSYTFSKEAMSRHFNAAFKGFTEISNGQFTRAEYRDHTMTKASRIDRVLVSTPPAVLKDNPIRTSNPWPVTMPAGVKPSDHVPTYTEFPKAKGQEGERAEPTVASWIAKHPSFPGHVARYIADFGPVPEQPVEAMRFVKEAMYDAAYETRRTARTMGARSNEEKLARALQAMRGDAVGDRRKVGDAKKAFGELAECITDDKVVLLDKLHQLISELTAKLAEERLQQIDKDVAAGSRTQQSAKQAKKKLRQHARCSVLIG